MAATVVVTETAEVLTTNADNTLIWTGPNGGDMSGVIYVDATETTGGSFVNYRRFARRITRYTTFTPTILIGDIVLHADDGPAGGSTWAIEVQDDGSGHIEVNVIGAALVNITWDIIVQYWLT